MKKINNVLSATFLFSTFVIAAESTQKSALTLDEKCLTNSPAKLSALATNELRLSAYNVENLFDAHHDKDKNDFAYLPSNTPGKTEGCQLLSEQYRESCLESDWNETAFTKKLALTENAFKAQYESTDAYPDFLLLTEVENPTSVMKLGEKLGYLSASNRKYPSQSTSYTQLYKKGSVPCQDLGSGVVMTNSPDERGIDVALLYKASNSNIEFVSCEEHLVEANKEYPTRNILAAKFLVGGSPVVVLGNHWPSQGGPTSARTAAAKLLLKLFDKYSAEGSAVIASGDFNTLPEEKNNPISDTLLGAKTVFDVSSKKTKSDRGSYYYGPKVQWTHLDRIFVNKALTSASSPLNVLPKTYLTHSFKELSKENKIWIFRDEAASKKYEAETGKELKYANFPETAQDPRVAAAFKKDPALDMLEVKELCSPARTYNFVNENGEVKQGGYSDHFAVSVSLSLKN